MYPGNLERVGVTFHFAHMSPSGSPSAILITVTLSHEGSGLDFRVRLGAEPCLGCVRLPSLVDIFKVDYEPFCF
jgi:hypothetical protein